MFERRKFVISEGNNILEGAGHVGIRNSSSWKDRFGNRALVDGGERGRCRSGLFLMLLKGVGMQWCQTLEREAGIRFQRYDERWAVPARVRSCRGAMDA